MPRPIWRHACGDGDWEFIARPDCPTSGEPAEFEAWCLTRHEARTRYVYVYGLKPLGPHRPMADAALGGMREHCARCQGICVLTSDDGASWSMCPACEGTGGLWTCPSDEVDAVRQAVLACYPGAAATMSAGFLRPSWRAP